MNLSFHELIALCQDENDVVTTSGLDALYEIFEHLCDGGNLANHPKWSAEEAAVLMGVGWVNLRDSVLHR